MKSYNRRKLMKRIIFVTLILLVVLIAAIVSCALITYHRQTELTADEMKQLDEQGIWKERTSAERARIIGARKATYTLDAKNMLASPAATDR